MPSITMASYILLVFYINNKVPTNQVHFLFLTMFKQCRLNMVRDTKRYDALPLTCDGSEEGTLNGNCRYEINVDILYTIQHDFYHMRLYFYIERLV